MFLNDFLEIAHSIKYPNVSLCFLEEAGKVQHLRFQTASLSMTLWFTSLSTFLSLVPSLLTSKISKGSIPYYCPTEISLKTVFSVLLMISWIAHYTSCPRGHNGEVLICGTEERSPSKEPDRPKLELPPFPLPRVSWLEDAYLRSQRLLKGMQHK